MTEMKTDGFGGNNLLFFNSVGFTSSEKISLLFPYDKKCLIKAVR